ncbi:hypothetical protein [Actinophytocola sp.]|uniref:hypothetical protein n=1 Tax=Actinophytocola sp. TaxID=1872138 RepID=UPI003D6B798D
MTIIGRRLALCLALCGLAAFLAACGDDTDAGAADYREMSPDEVCELVTVDEARDLMTDITDESLTPTKETSVGLPACRYGSGEGKPYLKVSIHQSSQLEVGGDVVATTVAGQEVLQEDTGGSCSVSVPLDEVLYLLAIVESWDPDKDTCPVARDAIAKASPRLTE